MPDHLIDELDNLSRDLRVHLRRLRLTSVKEYLAWCRCHGFCRSLQKSEGQLHAERLQQVRQLGEERLRATRLYQQPTRALRHIIRGERLEDEQVPPALVPVRRAFESSGADPQRRAYARRLLRSVSRRCPGLLTAQTESGDSYAGAVVRLTAHHRQAIRSIDSWRPTSKNAARRLGSLARHLYARWDVPRFMDSVWFEEGPESERHQRWFLHVGAGHNIRTVDLPVPYSKRMAYHFLQAPDDYTVDEALRWGQIHAMGGDARLVESLRGSPMIEDFAHNSFWLSVICFFRDNSNLTTIQKSSIVDYVHYQRFESHRIVDEHDVVRNAHPPQPNLSMSRRKLQALLRKIDGWRLDLGQPDPSTIRRQRRPNRTFPQSDVRALHHVDPSHRTCDQRLWTIQQLRTAGQLRQEGRAMRHCVGTYVDECRDGKSSIWSMKLTDRYGVARALTIQVLERDLEVREALGYQNEDPSPRSRRVLKRWASLNDLTMAPWVL